MSLDVKSFLGFKIGSNLVGEYVSAFLVFILALIVLELFKRLVLKRITILAGKTKNDFDDLLVDVINAIPWSFYLLLSLYFSIQFIVLPGILDKYLSYAVMIVGTYYVVRIIQSILDYGTRKVVAKRREEDRVDDVSIIKNMSGALKYSLWLVAALLILDNIGFNISALIAGVGIGGIAIAFALQNILEDIFSSLSIYLDKPFKVGDFIVIGEDRGEVRKIGIKTTRIKTLVGEELIVSNKELTNTRIHNFKHLERRRIVFGFGVTYDTPPEILRNIPEMVKGIISKQELAELDRVHFKEFADSSLNFEVVYYINSSEYVKYMDTQQEINLGLIETFAKEGIEFAFPSQTIYMAK
ncbi:MAG: mechanosensitive ion channel family protein [Candidatus Altiarchaeota archaeon]